ncbi:MAG TPA: PEGA domain-containing protein, partial [Polyangiales bacterium]|nr:PEGA domain-containing protein [Polyangiales bacterium]
TGALLPPSAAAADASDGAGVLLLTPTRNEDASRWTAIARGLQAVGQRALSVSDLALDPVFAACRAADCAERAAHAAQVTVAMFNGQGGERDASLTLELFDPDARHVSVATNLDGRSIAEAARALFETARREIALGDSALLDIASTPVGAIVFIDGQPLGVTPFEHPVAQGKHALRVVLDGFQADEQTIELGRGELRRLELHLQRRLLLTTTSRETAASAWNYALGGALVMLALPALIEATNRWANDGQCLEPAVHGCRERAHFGPRQAMLFAAGGVALIGGGYLILARPFRVALEAYPIGAGLRVDARF